MAIVPVPDPELASFILEEVEANCQHEPRLRDKLSASQAHRCLRAQVLELDHTIKRAPISVQGLMAFKQGHAIHDLIQAAFPDDPHEVEIKEAFVQGTYDQRFIDVLPDGDLMGDYKSMNVDTYVDFVLNGPKPEHVSQVTWYAYHAKCPQAAIIGINKNGKLSDFWKKRAVVPKGAELLFAWRFGVDPELAKSYDDKGKEALSHRARGTLPPFEEIPECRFCAVKHACSKAFKEGK